MAQRITGVIEETGEIVNLVSVSEGDRVISKAQAAVQFDFTKMNEKKLKTDNFIFAIFERSEEYLKNGDLRPQDIARLIMLATYTTYKGKLMMNNRTAMSKNDMRKILRESSPNRFNEMYNKLISLKIISVHEKEHYMTSSFFKRGKLGKGITATRVFVDEIRTIFNSIKVVDIKRVGYMFKLLPFLSHEYNIVCSNPDEIDLSLLRPFTKTEIAKIMNVDIKTLGRTLSNLSKIKTTSGHLIGWFTFGEDGIKLIVNPNVVYSGKTNGGEINAIKALFVQ